MGAYDLPRMVKIMSESSPADHRGKGIKIGGAVVGGATLKKHWEAGEGKGTPRTMISTGKWDYVVIQEIYCAGKREFEKYAALMDKVIRKAGAKTILFATANITQHYKGSHGYRYPDSFKKLNGMQVRFGKKHGISVAAAGYAWMKYLGPNPTQEQILDLYHKDKGHPGLKGSYIYACLLYAVITGRNPAGLTGEFGGDKKIGKEEAAKMQKAAWAQYLESSKK